MFDIKAYKDFLMEMTPKMKERYIEHMVNVFIVKRKAKSIILLIRSYKKIHLKKKYQGKLI